jgi:hypothetical protein
MQRRHFMAAASAGIAGVVTQSTLGQQPAKAKPDDDADDHETPMQKCADECYDCAQECDACANHCMEMVAKGKQDHLKTLRSCMDCADICRAAGAAAARSGVYSVTICKACAEVCEACAVACEKHKDDKMMAECAKACRDCAKECKNMVSHAAHA